MSVYTVNLWCRFRKLCEKIGTDVGPRDSRNCLQTNYVSGSDWSGISHTRRNWSKYTTVSWRQNGQSGLDVLDSTDFTAVYHSFFIQCSITLNETNITHTTELYHYRSYLEILLTYCIDVSNAFWCLDRVTSSHATRPKPIPRTRDS